MTVRVCFSSSGEDVFLLQVDVHLLHAGVVRLEQWVRRRVSWTRQDLAGRVRQMHLLIGLKLVRVKWVQVDVKLDFVNQQKARRNAPSWLQRCYLFGHGAQDLGGLRLFQFARLLLWRDLDFFRRLNHLNVGTSDGGSSNWPNNFRNNDVVIVVVLPLVFL